MFGRYTRVIRLSIWKEKVAHFKYLLGHSALRRLFRQCSWWKTSNCKTYRFGWFGRVIVSLGSFAAASGSTALTPTTCLLSAPKTSQRSEHLVKCDLTAVQFLPKAIRFIGRKSVKSADNIRTLLKEVLVVADGILSGCYKLWTVNLFSLNPLDNSGK